MWSGLRPQCFHHTHQGDHNMNHKWSSGGGLSTTLLWVILKWSEIIYCAHICTKNADSSIWDQSNGQNTFKNYLLWYKWTRKTKYTISIRKALLSRTTYIYLTYTTELLRFKDLAQGSSIGTLAEMGFELFHHVPSLPFPHFLLVWVRPPLLHSICFTVFTKDCFDVC